MRRAHTPKSFTTLQGTDAYITPAELLSRSRAAARMALRGKGYSTEDRVDAAADCVLRVLESIPGGRNVSAIPATGEHGASFTRLTGMAANYRRKIDADRERDTADALANAQTSFTPAVTGEDAETRGTPLGAARAALEMLADTGLPCSGVYRSGYYSAARSAAGMQSREIAAELGISAASLRKHLSRLPKQIAPVHTPAQWAEALHIPDTATAAAHRSKTLRKEERERPDTAAPVAVRRHPGRKLTPELRGKLRRSTWAQELTPMADARLASAARMSRARVAKLTASERVARRAAAGIPGPVR